MRVRIALLAALLLAIPMTASAQAQWPRYVEKSGREKALYGIRSIGRGKYGLLGGVSVQAVWFTDLSLRAWVSNKVDQERLTPNEAEDVYRDMRAQYRMDDNYVFYLLANTITQGVQEAPLNLEGVILQRAGAPDTFTKGGAAPAELKGIGIASPQFTYTVAVPKRLADGSPLVRSESEVVELSVATIFQSPAVMKFEVKDFVGKKRRIGSVGDL